MRLKQFFFGVCDLTLLFDYLQVYATLHKRVKFCVIIIFYPLHIFVQKLGMYKIRVIEQGRELILVTRYLDFVDSIFVWSFHDF